MTTDWIQVPGRIAAVKDGVSWFDTGTKTFGLVSPKALVLPGTTLTFPKFRMDNLVYWQGQSLGGSPPQFFECMRAFITMLPQEWGPVAVDSSFTDDLPDTFLGFVPAGTDYVDVQVIINRTKDPVGDTTGQAFNTGINDDPISVIVPTNTVVKLVGVSCPLEECVPMSRFFSIVLVPNANPALPGSVYLRRRQSATAIPNLNFTTNTALSGGYTYGTSPGTPVTMLATHSLTQVDGNFFESGFTWQRGGSNFNSQQLPLTDNTDYSSVYNLDLVITPGFFKTPNAPVPPSSRKSVKLGYFQDQTAVSTNTFNGTVPAPIESPNRVILLQIAAVSGGNSIISAVTVNGVSATKAVDANKFDSGIGVGYASSIWAVSLPLGTGFLSISITTSASVHPVTLDCLVWAAYNVSVTPLDTDTRVTPGTLSVSSTAGGPVLGISSNLAGGSPPYLSGMDLYSAFLVGNSNIDVGYSLGDGTTKSAVLATGPSDMVGCLASFA